MENFEINSLLRLLRSSIKSTAGKISNPNAAATNVNFINSGQRFETLKSLHKQLKKRYSVNSLPIGLNLIHSIFDVLKVILAELISTYYSNISHQVNVNPNQIRSNQIAVPIITPLRFQGKRSVENVFLTAVRRNEILEIVQIVIEILSNNQQTTTIFLDSNNNTLDQFHQDCYGRIFLPEMIALLGHDSTDVQRYSIRFLQLFITQTNNLQKFMLAYVEYGLESDNLAIQFGALNALSYLFIKPEMRAENLGPLIGSLGKMLLNTQSTNLHLFYPTYATMERFNALLGSKRFFTYLYTSTDSPNVAILFENIQKRAPSPQIFIEPTGR